MTVQLTCWKCGATFGIFLPLGRKDECPGCLAELRVCRQCEFYDSHAGRECREPMAEPEGEKDRANFCDWFRPQLRGGSAVDDKAAALADLDALFSGSESSSPSGAENTAKQKLEQLFGRGPAK
jgi:hypothetical protein